MAYYGDYYRGDYYRGDYYQGDPIFGLIGLGVKAAKSIIPKAIKGAIGLFSKPKVAGAIGAAATGTAIVSSIQQPPMIAPPADLPGMRIPGTGTMIDLPNILPGGLPGVYSTGTGGAGIPRGYHINKNALKRMQGKKYGPYKNVIVRNRSMNVTNPRALRRALRRGQGFIKLARRFISFYSPKAPKGRAYFRRKK